MFSWDPERIGLTEGPYGPSVTSSSEAPLNEPSPNVRLAFERVGAVAAQLALQRRSIRSAAVKQALLRSEPSFDEKVLGFDTFRDFLRGAETAGFIELANASTGPDVDVLAPGVARSPGSGGTRRRVREDLWHAFTDWTLGLIRFWHPEANRAFAVTASESAGEPVEETSARLAFLANPAPFVPIDPIPRETVYEWMTAFARSAPDGTSERLLAALQAPMPFRSFTNVVRELGLGAAWSSEHTQHVAERIQTWARARDIDVDPFEPRATTASTSKSSFAAAVDEDRVRAMAHRLVDHMPVTELLNIRVRLGDLFTL